MTKRLTPGCQARRTAIAATLALTGSWAPAAELYSEGETRVRLDTTAKYSVGTRLSSPMPALAANPVNTDDGSYNFSKGSLITNRLDLLSELDATSGAFGFRLSAAAWSDLVYRGTNDNPGPPAAVTNNLSVPYNRFTAGTRDLHGSKAEVLDAFLSWRGDVAGYSALVRAGRHTVLFGESLFFGTNGIAAANAPLDFVKATTIPNAQAKELFMPVPQLSAQLQVSPDATLLGYVQTGFRGHRLPSAGSFWEPVDFIGDGAESLLVGPGNYLARGADQKPSSSGQWGLGARFKIDPVGELGVYAARFHDKFPALQAGFYPPPPGAPLPPPGSLPPPGLGELGSFSFRHYEGIRLLGVSLNTSVGDANVGAELSFRSNQPLISNAFAGAVAVGKTVHAQVNAIIPLTRTELWDSGIVLGEVAWNKVREVTENAAALDPANTRDAAGLRVVFQPGWSQVLPGLDLNVPIAVGYNPRGLSQAVPNFNGGYNRGGDWSIGVAGEYLQTWKFSLNLQRFFGTFNLVRDRNNLTFSAQTTF